MLKPLLFMAVTANLFFIVRVKAHKTNESTEYTSSTTYSETHSSSSSSTSVITDCDEDENISCGGDPNAQPGCDKECRRRCPNQGPQKCSCPKENSCECKKGYVFDAVMYKCVRPNNCTKTKLCPKPNEVYDVCPATCPPRRCDVDERVIRCAAPLKPGHPDCKPGCRCADNYKRNDKGICIRKEECPQFCPGPNEVFDWCPASCPPQRCDVDITVILCPVPLKYGDPKCEPSCRCKDDYVRNSTGICIPRDQCEPQCPENETYHECPDKLCDPQNCTQLGFGVNCTGTDDDTCPGKPGCICKYGYLRNEKGVCIPQKECPSCKSDPHAEAGCGVYCNQRCSTIGKEAEVCTLLCYPNSCDCKEGYFLDEHTGKCVLPKHCTPTCGKHEVYSNCVNGGCEARNCTQLGFPVPCVRPKTCKKGCICEENYLRNDIGICVPRSECPSCGGDENAKPGCGVNCGKHCADYLGYPLGCPKICKPNGCDCKKDYYYDDNYAKCVPGKDCSPYCSREQHEVYSECINGGCQAKNCSQLGKPIPCVKIHPDSCIKGCLCEQGYLRAPNGTCIPEDQCNPCTRPNEYYDKCSPTWPPQTCESIGKKYPYPAIKKDSSRCKPACRCKNGHYRNKLGECISKENCLKCKGLFEYYSCGGACDNECATIKTQNQTHCPIINIKCNERCYCEKDYARNKNGTCIPISKCEPQCPVNEEYVQCPVGLCRAQKCDQLGYPINCTQPDPCPVKPGCVCKLGYARNNKGVCIPLKECSSCGGDKNATSGCGFCGQYCSDIGKGPVACPAVCKINGCQCRKGYNYDSNTEKCVLPKDCTRKCGPNQKYENCPAGLCRPQNCTQVGFPISCPATTPDSGCPGKPGCVCIENYAKNDKGVCIPIKECPSCRGDTNAISGCGYCGHRCSDIGKGPVPCPRLCEVNGCQCRKGLYYDKNIQKCVPPENCTHQCGPNEDYVTCPMLLCRPENCTQAGFPIACPLVTQDFKCPEKPRCVCKTDYARNDKGVCVPIKECPECRGDRNATSGCGYCGQRCSDIDKSSVVCPLICEINGCQCKKGFFYDKNIGKCVLPKDCSPQCGQYEKYELCPSELCGPQNCTEVGFPKTCLEKETVSKCHDKPGCVCVEGYARNDKGVCVPLKECRSQCGLHEEYIECPASFCRPENCSELGYQILCSLLGPDEKCPVKPKCVCVQGYARNEKGVCVPVNECPSCGGDNNATSGCGYCGHRCIDIGKMNVVCPRIACRLNDCQCKEGYFYNTETDTCVRPKDCPSPCGKNEEISSCANGGCDRRNCTQLGKPKLCIDPIKCKIGCICKKGYLRDPKGVCVPIKKCSTCGDDPNAQGGCGNFCNRRCSDIGNKPKPCTKECREDGCDCKDGYYYDDITEKCVKPENCTCPKPNQIFDLCPITCPPQTCESLDRAYICPLEKGQEEPCIPGCRCKDGYYSNIDGQCNTQEQCRKCNKPHEFFACGVPCDNVCATLSTKNQTNCPIVNKRCTERCYCEKGYARAQNGSCIAIPRCNEPQCNQHEEYICPTEKCRPEKCSELGYPLNCTNISSDNGCPVKHKCVCVDGYVRNEKGICILSNKCPSCRGDPNATPGCGFCFTKQCPGHGEGVACAAICDANGCVCKDYHYYDSIQKKCVPVEDCTPICPKNEVPSNCVNGGCDKRNCSQLGQPDICINVIKCHKGCVCKEGYLRNDKDICVPIKKCPLKCGDNEILHNCTEGYCEAKTCGDLGFPVACPDLTPEQCTRECLCISDYVRADSGKCIKKTDCPSCGGDENAQYGCGVNCGKHCRDMGKKNYVCTKICNFNACDCKPGYYLNENTGKCVLPKICPPQCPKNEVYNPCVQGDCKPQNCSQLGFPISCPRINPDDCKGGCMCVEGLIRADNGTCIPPEECPSCGGDKNAKYGCGINCGKRCSDIGKEVGCIDLCRENACDCKEGYYLNEISGKCVLPKKCPPTCPAKEEYNSCIENHCQPTKCSQVGFPIDCPKKGSYRCTGGCLCKDGLVKADNGTCIPIKKCPSCGGDSNAESGCGVHCNRRCRDIGRENTAGACIEICYINSCDCKPGYYFDENTKKCVLPKKCTRVCDQPHEVFDPCPRKCPPQQCTSINKKFHCPLISANRTYCKPGCRCEKNYFRNLIGECISRQNCFKCPGRHEYFSCGVLCDTECATLKEQSRCNCPEKDIKCTERCYCEDGYARDANNTCIPIEDCPHICDEDTTTTTPAPSTENVTELLENYKKADIALAGQFIYEMYQNNPEKSFVVSPFSVLILFAQLLMNAIGLAREQLIRVTNLDNNNKVELVIPAVIRSIKEQQNVTLEVAFKIYANKDYPLEESFIDRSTRIFNATAENIYFSENKEAAKIINKWVEIQTHNEIKDLIPADALSMSTRLVMVNAVYFHGLWKKPFNVDKTKDGDFYVSPNKTIRVPYMHQTNTFEYSNFAPLNAQILKMDYSGGNVSLIVILPTETYGVADLVDKLRDTDLFVHGLGSLSPVKLEVSLPKYNIESSIDGTDLSKKANVTEMFNPNSKSFKDITKSEEPLFISAALQKARIESDEKGSTAAAATGIIFSTTSALYPPPEIPVFDANHPHVYGIFLKRDPIFVGVFSG